jgi:hypothetical protein
MGQAPGPVITPGIVPVAAAMAAHDAGGSDDVTEGCEDVRRNHHGLLTQGTTPCSMRTLRRNVGRLAQALKQTSREATVLLYAQALDPTCRRWPNWPTGVFCIYSEPAGAKGREKAEARTEGEQRTLEAYS